MKRLTNTETKSLLDAVTLLHSHSGTQNVHTRILQAVSRVSAAEWYAIDSFHPQGYWLNLSWQMPGDSATPKDVESFGRHASEHPLFKAFVAGGLPEPRKITDYLTNRQFHRLAIYNEFFRSVGTDRQLLTGLPVSTDLTLVLSLNRIKRDFSEGNRQLLSMLRPHLIAAFQNTEALTELKLQQSQLEMALEESGCAAILIDANGKVKLATELARVWLAKYFVTSPGAVGDLPGELRDWLSKHSVRATDEERLAAPVQPFEVVRNEERLRIRLVRNHQSAHSLLLIDEELSVTTESLESLGLTRREGEILRWLANGKTNSDIALLCNISKRTVHKHVEHIYQKLGVETRIAAAHKALSVMKLAKS